MRKLLLTTAMIAGFSLPAAAETIEVGVNGLVCAFCATGIENSFKDQSGVESVKVDLDNKLVTLKTRPEMTIDDRSIKETITDAGYNVTSIRRQK